MKKDELIKKLESLDSPQLEMPAHKQRLKHALLNNGHFQAAKGTGFWSAINEFGGSMFMKSHAWKVALALVPLFIVAFTFQSFFASEQAAAYLTLQVNPALQLALDKDNKVIGLMALNDDGNTIIAGVDVQDKTLEQALQEITGQIIAGGFVKKDAEIVIALRPAPGAETTALPEIAEFARKLVIDRLAKDKLQADVESIVVNNELYSKASEEGILPKSYAKLVEANISTDTINALLSLKNEPGISQSKFDEKFEDIAEAFMDMVEAGISEQTAIAALKEALKAYPNLEEIDKVADVLIELKKSGLAEADALNKTKEAIAANPQLDNLDETLGTDMDKGDEDNDPDEALSADVEDDDKDDGQELDDDNDGDVQNKDDEDVGEDGEKDEDNIDVDDKQDDDGDNTAIEPSDGNNQDYDSKDGSKSDDEQEEQSEQESDGADDE